MRAAVNSETNIEANALSIVLALSVAFNGHSFNALFSGDSDPHALSAGLNKWNAYALENGLHATFSVVKVPHHGSLNNHVEDICQAGSDQPRVAMISAGNRSRIPHPDVLNRWLNSNWTTYLTTMRSARRTYSRPMDILSRPSRRIVFATHDICAQWSVSAGLNCSPPSARIMAEHVPAYA